VKESRVLDRLEQLGFTQLMSDDHYGPSLALGTVDVSLQELTNAYRQLSLAAPQPVFTDETKRQLFAALSLQEYRRFTFGLDSLLGLPFPAAVKTGTSKDMRDNWCVGYTSDYTVGVWVGNFNGQPMWNVSGLTGAAPIWRQLMMGLHRTPPRDELAHYEAPEKPLEQKTISRIRYPQSNMLIGIDPDIPRANQRVSIQISAPQADHVVFIDGKRLARSQETVFWEPKKGRHEVELKTRDGHRVDDVSFVVR
jgi:penicillin-binding protein 1C